MCCSLVVVQVSIAGNGMKVESSRPVRTNALKRLQRFPRSESGAFADEIQGEAEVVNPKLVGASSPLMPVEALIGLQEIGDATSSPSRAILRGEDLLNLLEGISLGLLAGRIPLSRLDAILSTVKSHRQTVVEPRLSSILDEIELRASVELAKLGRPPN